MTVIDARSHSVIPLIAFAAFVGLGLTFGLMGVGWLTIRPEFGLEVGDLGSFTLLNTVGYIVTSFFSGRIMTRFGNGQTLLLGCVLIAAGLFGIAGAPSWVLMIGVGIVMGAGAGLIDAGLNSYIALYHNARQMNWLHACFGIGITIAPVLMTWTVVNMGSWRAGFGVVAIYMVVIAALFVVTLRAWRNDLPQTEGQKPVANASVGTTLRLPILWLSIALFFVYAGMELGVGQWAPTILTETRGIPFEVAGTWAAIYAGSFTIGRIFFGIISNKINVLLTLRLCMIGAIIGAALFWLNPSEALGFIGLALFGFAQAPLFPLLILETANRVGIEHAANAIGFQVSAAGLGIAVLPFIAGKIADATSLEFFAPFFFALAVSVLVLHEISLMRSPKAARVTSAAAD